MTETVLTWIAVSGLLLVIVGVLMALVLQNGDDKDNETQFEDTERDGGNE